MNEKSSKQLEKQNLVRAFRRAWNFVLRTPISSLILALLVSALIVMLLGYDPVEIYKYIFVGAFGNWDNIVTTLGQMTPVLFCGLSYLLARMCGLSNMGMEGQYLAGAFAAAVAGIYVPQGLLWLGPVVPLLSAAFWGGLVAFLPAILKRMFGSNEMLVSLMINYALTYLCQYLVNYVYMNPDNIIPVTSPVMEETHLSQLVPGTQFTSGFLIAIAFTVIMWFVLYKTIPGYKIRAVGANTSAAMYKGLRIGRIQMWTYIVAGMIGGIGGGVQVLGVHYYYIHGMTTGYGWDGIAAALLGAGEPFGNIAGSLVYGALRAGSLYLSRMTDVNSDFIYVIEGIMILFIAMPEMMRHFMFKEEPVQKLPKIQEAKKAKSIPKSEV